MWPFLIVLWLMANDEKCRKHYYLLQHVKEGGCSKEFRTAIKKCRHASSDADAEACIKATAALRKCFAKKPDWFGSYFTDRMDNGLDQDRKLTPKQIEEEELRELYGYRWWTGMRRN
ncbi:unnamed protein product [Alopecurus aequalis]